mgnify:CR=1 FL=1
MWSKLTSRVSSGTIDHLLTRAEGEINAPDSKEAVKWAKRFFFEGENADNNLDLLKLIHLDLWPEISSIVNFKEPIIDHASLLIKSPGGEATRMHQDSAYWEGREISPSIFSVWIALEQMTREKGGLNLLKQNEVPANRMFDFNKGSTYEHETLTDTEESGGFPILIKPEIQSELCRSMKLIDLQRGEAVAFDSYEPHMTEKNTSETPRLAMKIAYADGGQKTDNKTFLIKVRKLENLNQDET